MSVTLEAQDPTIEKTTLSQVRGPIHELADSNIIGIVFAKRVGPIIDANDEFLRTVGYTRDDLAAGKLNWVDMTPPEWSVVTRLARKQMDETGKAAPFEMEFFRKDGSRVPILIGVVALQQSDLDGLSFVLDLTERKQAERDMDRLMVERFAMLDSVGDGIYGLDKDARCTFINAAGVRMLGYEPEECQGRNMHDLIHYQHADGSPFPAESCPLLDALTKSTGVRLDNEVLWRKDGSCFAAECSSYPVVVNGHVEGTVVSFKDISEWKKAEEILRASEQRFRAAFAHAAAGMCISDSEGRLLEVNQALCHMTGYSEAELMDLTAQTITHPDDLDRPESFFKLVSHESQGFVANRRYIRKDGNVARARCSVAVLSDGSEGPTRFITIAEDITEQVKAKADLRHTEQRYRSIVENAQEGICMFDAERNITYSNPRLKSMLGYAESERCSNIYFEEDQEDCSRRFDLGKAGLSDSHEIRLKCADGSALWVNSSSSPIPDDEGRFAGSLCMFTDITARKLLEEQLRQVQKMEAVGQLAGGLAHDFNNLLTVILGYSGVLESKLSPEDPRLKNVTEIRRAGERAAALTRKLLALSRKQVLQPRVISVNHLIRDLESMLRRLIGEDIELVTELGRAAGNIKADPGQVEQVILNLVINARDAMPRGGRLTIKSQREDLDPAGAASLSLPPGTYVLLTFTDTGCGIDEKTKARIFEPFFTTKEPGVGTGLGLATVLGIVNQSGGAVYVQSEIDVGTAFRIYLPLVEDRASDIESPQVPAAAPAGEVILLVEDNGVIRLLAREVLEEHGYRVLEAANAEEALAVAELSPAVDLLLTDVVMAGMNGHDLAKQLTTLRPGLKVLFMSGYAENGIVQQGALEPGLNFLAKPFPPQELLWKTAEVLAKNAAPARLLIVDDDDEVRSYLSTLLESAGYSIVQASNGREAEARCQEMLPDLVITDLVMPEREGLETIHTICQRWPQLPVIAMSGAFEGTFLELAKRMGADVVLQKPFQEGIILSEVRRLTAK